MIIYNKIIPFNGYKCMNLFGIIFSRTKNLSDIDINHEQIHTYLMRELLYIPFYIIYIIEYLYRLITTENAYKSVSFEKEAYTHEKDLNYLKDRKVYAQWR